MAKKAKKEAVDDEVEVSADSVEESAEKKEFRRTIEAYKLRFPEKWENGGKKEELTAILDKMV